MKEKQESNNSLNDYKEEIKEEQSNPSLLKMSLTIDLGEYDYDLSGLDVDEH